MGSPGIHFVAESSDSPASGALYEAFVADIVERYPGWSPADSGHPRPAAFAPPMGDWLIGYRGSRPVACGGLERIRSDMAEIRRVFVARDCRSEGVGSALLEALIDRARLLGYRRVCLDTGERQPEALGLFRGAGFREVEPFNANPFAVHWLGLDLA